MESNEIGFKAIESFMYYMWNMWGEDECFNGVEWQCQPSHIWSKWSEKYDSYGPNGAIGPFFGELDNENRRALITRALSKYNGRCRIR